MFDCGCSQPALDAASGLESSGLSLATTDSSLGLAPLGAPQSAAALGGDVPLQISPAPASLLSEESIGLPNVALAADLQTASGIDASQDSLTGLAETSSPLVGAFAIPGIGCIFRVPDLTIAPDPELRSNPDGTVTISWAVTNTRTSTRCADVAANSFYNRFWLSSDDVLDVTNDTSIAAVGGPNIDDVYYTNQQAIAAGETSTLREETFSLGGGQPYLILSVNQPRGISESDYTNNVAVFDLAGAGGASD